LAGFFQDSGQLLESISIANQFLSKANKIENQLAALYLKIRGFIYTGGNWKQAEKTYRQYKSVLQEAIAIPDNLEIKELMPVLNAGIFSHYFEDSPREYRVIRNAYAKICQDKLQTIYSDRVKNYNHSRLLFDETNSTSKKIKVGYISSCLRNHSVGWLVRWPFVHHDRDRFEIHVYSTNKKEDSMQKTIEQICEPYFHDVSLQPEDEFSQKIPLIANKILEDEIDILIDLDSLTSHINNAVMALKPAPVQITWLGFDASGFPAVDYFIADPYVLPSSASEYYTENIWRLPQTYIAVDGFEVGVPTLRRDRLGIPNDAIVYFSSQTGSKRNPHNVRSQMRILKEVPNSYFLIKGLKTDLNAVKQFFEAMAESEGVDCDRLRFLPNVPWEATHRANLKIADVVLDTYPYNGATTTLETLWMEIPLVTQVGTQFAARNSYSMLTNAGVTEGIAWNEEKYIEWGIRLGKDLSLRQKVVWQLRVAKQTSLLWNAEQFTRNLEQAYEQMWQYYVQGGKIEN
jgi:predicted O-linked N-acetylglucosamine transferase (SPINDLY family)